MHASSWCIRFRQWFSQNPTPHALKCKYQLRNYSLSVGQRAEIADAPVKPYYVTTPIFYPNSVPHIGHLYTIITADIFVRYHRILNPQRPVYFQTGTDEHGLKIQRAAELKKLHPLEFCDQLSQRFRDLARMANSSHTRFIRTTEQEHYDAVKHIWHQLDGKGLIYKDHYEGWYSVTDECFYADSQVTKTSIPSGASTEKAEVVTSSETGSIVEWSHEENYKFRLSAFRESLLAHYRANPQSILPAQHQDQIINILSSSPLEDLSVSRPRSRLHWGVPVPYDSEQTMYVWFDALSVYLSGIGYPWKGTSDCGIANGWPVDMQVIGKDILRFHAIYLPAILQALDLPLQGNLLCHAHWTMNQKKMSKSVGNVADPFEAMETYGVDVVRYYMARVGGRFKDDVDWSQEQLRKHSNEIQSLLGNFYLRITSDTIHAKVLLACEAYPSDVSSPAELESASKYISSLLSSVGNLSLSVSECFDKRDLMEALSLIVACLREANAVMTNIAPWSSSPATARLTYECSLEVLRVCGICLQPFMPITAEKLLDALHIDGKERTWAHAAAVETGRPDHVDRSVRLFNK